MAQTVLRIDASARYEGSVTRDLTARILERIGATEVITRDLAQGVPLIDEAWVGANFTPAEERSAEQKAALALSDTLVAEVEAADTLVIGLPMYNFGVPAAVKAWIDQIARAGVTFQYSPTGPVGLLKGKRAIIALATGGTAAGSEIDFATDYIRHVLGFIGIDEVEFVTADRLMADADGAREAAQAQVDRLAA